MVTKTETFSATESVQTWTVPQFVDEITIETWGAGGGDSDYLIQNGYSTPEAISGAPGGYSKGTLSVSGGDTLYLYVGSGSTAQTSGWPNGGGNVVLDLDDNDGSDAYELYASGGGGSSSVRLNSDDESSTVIEAGGGGGGVVAINDYTHKEANGYGGGLEGSGHAESCRTIDGTERCLDGNSGGDQSCGGSSPNGGGGATDDGDESEGVAAGGGGGGYCGGEGGVARDYSGFGTPLSMGHGGAGGSGYLDDSLTNTTTSTGDGNSGDGQISITYNHPVAKYYDGSAWNETYVKVWDGDSWVEKPIYQYDGGGEWT